MKLSWKKIGSGVLAGLKIGALLNPEVAVITGAIESVQAAIPDQPGADKKQTVIDVTDAVLSSSLLGLRPEQQAAITEARSAFIDAYVAARAAEAAVAHAHDTLLAAIAAAKGDGTGHP